MTGFSSRNGETRDGNGKRQSSCSGKRRVSNDQKHLSRKQQSAHPRLRITKTREQCQVQRPGRMEISAELRRHIEAHDKKLKILIEKIDALVERWPKPEYSSKHVQELHP
jgi:hypothetical protein